MNAVSSSSRLSPMSSVGTSSRASSQTPSVSKSRKRKSRTNGSFSRLPPLEIPLPDPSQPIPTNWLRSQTTLLGHAGLVAGVKPASLSHGFHRGSTPANPIVVDDTSEATIGPNLSEKSKTPRQHHHNDPFANLELPPPPTRDIVDILIKQKEVVPVLQDLLKLFSGNPGLAYRALNSPPPKRRKLDRVPAGAVDWDVPYPFQEGEGPQSYHDGWAQDRAKQLVSQLVALIKTASRKAALRNYLKGQNQLREHLEEKRRQSECITAALKDSEHSEPKIHGHYKPATRFYGIDKLNVPDTTADIPAPSPSDTAYPSPSQQATPFHSSSSIEDLISSLVTTVPIGQSNNETASDLSASSNYALQHTNEIDGVTDNWMALFQSIIPDQNQDFAFGMTTNQDDGTPSAAASDVQMDFDFSTFPESSSDTASAMSAFTTSFLDSPQLMDIDSGISEASATMPDIDTLFGHTFTGSSHSDPLAVSIPHISASGTPSLAASPIPSSFGGDFPMTPLSGVGSELNANGILDFGFDVGSTMPPQDSVPDDVLNAASSLMALGRNMSGPWSGPSDGLDNMEGISDVDGNGAKHTGLGKEKAAVNPKTDISQSQGDSTPSLPTSGTNDGIFNTPEDQAGDTEQDVETVKDVIPILMSAVLPMGIPLQTHNVHIGTSSVFTPRTPLTASSQLPRKPLDRSELLRLAKERRAKLAEEIIKTRTQLWETTIEHGVLMHLSKFYA